MLKREPEDERYDVAQHIITMLSTKEAQLDTLGIRAKTATGITLSQCVIALITLQDLRFDMKTRRKERISEHKVTFEDKEIAEYKKKR